MLLPWEGSQLDAISHPFHSYDDVYDVYGKLEVIIGKDTGGATVRS